VGVLSDGRRSGGSAFSLTSWGLARRGITLLVSVQETPQAEGVPDGISKSLLVGPTS